MIDPLHVTGVTLNRATGVFSGGTGAQNLTARPALGRLSFEGIAIYPNGVTYFGDENRPSRGTAGGAYYNFRARCAIRTPAPSRRVSCAGAATTPATKTRTRTTAR